MSEAEQSPPPAAAPADPAPAASAGARVKRDGVWTHPALWLALLALGLLGWHSYATRAQLDSLQEQFARRLADGEGVAREARALAQQKLELLQIVQAKTGALEAKLAESQSQQVALQAMYQDLSRNQDDRALAEVEQALTLAAQQLEIGGNVAAALIALQGADARLMRAESAQFLPVRKMIHRDIERLKALPSLDLPGMALRLEGAGAAVDAMPLVFEGRPRGAAAAPVEAAAPAEEADTLQGRLAEITADLWREVRQLIRIERLERPEPALLAPEHAYFLRENLKLRLMNARLALLQRDTKIFRADIGAAQAWIERYFDTSSKSVRNVVEALQPLSAAQLELELPTLEDSLTAVRSFKLASDKAPPQAKSP